MGFQFRFGATDPYWIRPPRYLINFAGILSLNLFWTEDKTVEAIPVRDIYKLEYQVFKQPAWSVFYLVCVVIFMTHACLGWKKVTPALGIPKMHHKRVEVYGYIIFITLGLIYISFPLFCLLTTPFGGKEPTIQ